jgi:hypothetical protein
MFLYRKGYEVKCAEDIYGRHILVITSSQVECKSKVVLRKQSAMERVLAF